MLITEWSIADFIDPASNTNLHALVAFVHFLIGGERNILALDRWNDPTIVSLFKDAKDITQKNVEAENQKLKACVPSPRPPIRSLRRSFQKFKSVRIFFVNRLVIKRIAIKGVLLYPQ